MIQKIFSLFRTEKVKELQSTSLSNIETEKKNIDFLIGDKIIEIRTVSAYRKINNWLDTHITFIKLERNGIIQFPFSGDEYFENISFEKNAEPILNKFQKIIYNSIIDDIYYILAKETTEFDFHEIGYIALNNDYILEENRMSPSGTGGANMFCKSLEMFKEELISNQIQIYSVKEKAIKNF